MDKGTGHKRRLFGVEVTSILSGFFVSCVLCLGPVLDTVPFVWAQRAATEIEGLVPVQEVDPTIVVDIRYATENNFTGKKVYPVAVAVLRKETVLKLAAANKEFQEKGYRIKVWDGYRPPYVQKIFWEIMPDDRYVANPNTGGSKHNRGGAVDVTLVNQKGEELEMPSAYDDFSERAWRNSVSASPKAKENVEYLTSVMAKHGFAPYEHEWWHFDDPDYKNFPLVDVPLERFLASPVKPAGSALVFKEVPRALNDLPQDVTQAIVISPKTDAGFQAKLSAWEKKDNAWQAKEVMDAVVGRNGFAPIAEKQEGDGRTPSGIFQLSTAFGYKAFVKTRLSYRQTTTNDFWVDDPASPQYNQWVSGTPQAGSFEKMKREDDLYKYGVVIEYNTNPVVPGKGSAIFMHVWRGPDKPTAGCVAVSEKNILKLLKWLDDDSPPAIVLGSY